MIGGLGSTELMMIVFVIFLLFGARKIPEFARGLGEARREFRSSAFDDGDYNQRPAQLESPAPASSADMTENQKLIQVAKGLGISTEGVGIEEIRTEVNTKLT